MEVNTPGANSTGAYVPGVVGKNTAVGEEVRFQAV